MTAMARIGVTIMVSSVVLPFGPVIADERRLCAGRAHCYEIPASISANCSRDVTTEINSWIGGLPDGSADRNKTLVFGTNACYRVDGTVDLVNRSFLVLDGNGSTIRGNSVVGGPGRSQFRSHDGTNLVFQNFVIRGSHPNPRPGGCVFNSDGTLRLCDEGGYTSRLEWQHAFEIRETDNVIISNNRVHNVYGDHVAITWHYPGDVGHNAVIENNAFDGSGRHCISLAAHVGVRISGNTFSNCGYHVIDIEPEQLRPIIDVVIENNTVGSHRYAFVSNTTGECVPGNSGNITIRGNVMTAPGVTWLPPIYIQPPSAYPSCPAVGWSGYTVEKNTLLKAWQDEALIIGPNVSDIAIVGNTITLSMSARPPAISLNKVSGNVAIRNNAVSGTARVYTIDGVVHGAGVDSCGNTTSVGENQPRVCPERDFLRSSRRRN